MQTREQKLLYLKKTIDTIWHGADTKTGEYPTIINLYKEVLKISPKDTDAWENMIWLMWSLSVNENNKSWLNQAELFAKRYLSIMPNGYRAFEFVGMFYRSMKKDERLAVRFYESAIRWKDCPLSTHHSLISVCEKSGDKLKAIGYCKMTLNRFSNDPYTKSKLQSLSQ